MQNTTLDSVVSSNSQELSSVEYVDSHENSIATIPRDDASVQDVEDPRSLELIFGQKHNEIDCALCPTAKRACNRAWFSAKQVENWSEMSKKTLWRWLERIEKAHRISRVSDMTHVDVSTSTGAVKTTLYNLNVLNQLAMVCIDLILDEMADAHKTTPKTIREILRLASIELQNAHSEHAFSMYGESADHIFA